MFGNEGIVFAFQLGKPLLQITLLRRFALDVIILDMLGDILVGLLIAINSGSVLFAEVLLCER